jgi:hypothetical protein
MYRHQGAFASFSNLDDPASSDIRRSSNGRRSFRGRGRGRGRGAGIGFVRTGGSSLDTQSKTSANRNTGRHERKESLSGREERQPLKEERKNRWKTRQVFDAIICTICHDRWHTRENHKCEVCAELGHGGRDHKCDRCTELGHTTEEHTACDYCKSKEHTYLEHVCDKCSSLGHDVAHHCPVVTCEKLHDLEEHKCSVCGEQGHEEHLEKHCDICMSIAHARDKHVCNICNGHGHDADLNPSEMRPCFITMFAIVKSQTQTIKNLAYRVAKQSRQIRFLRSKIITRCTRCSGTGLIKTGRGYDSDPEVEKCECQENVDPGSESEDDVDNGNKLDASE